MTNAPKLEKPAPAVTEESRPFWDGCAAGELRLQHCDACETIQFPPHRFCSGCLSADLRFEAASGRGIVRSWSVVRYPISEAFAAEAPYLVALVQLDEGPTMFTGLHGCEIDAANIGMQVEVEFERRTGDVFVPYFRPV